MQRKLKEERRRGERIEERREKGESVRSDGPLVRDDFPQNLLMCEEARHWSQ